LSHAVNRRPSWKSWKASPSTVRFTLLLGANTYCEERSPGE
jgi:hypothetical protein